jgi:hypothetical protein
MWDAHETIHIFAHGSRNACAFIANEDCSFASQIGLRGNRTAMRIRRQQPKTVTP